MDDAPVVDILEAVDISDTDVQPPVPKKPKTSIQGKGEDFILKTDSAAKDHLHKLLAKTFFTCNIPFSVVEHPFLVELFKYARPVILYRIEQF